jgi:hypothetical protein
MKEQIIKIILGRDWYNEPIETKADKIIELHEAEIEEFLKLMQKYGWLEESPKDLYRFYLKYTRKWQTQN